MSMMFVGLMACGGGNTEATTENQADEIPGKVEGGVNFDSPADGATVTSPVTIKMTVAGMEVEPAGMVNEGKGHHHLVIDGSFVEKGTVVPTDSTHIHFGKGQTETEVELSPGKHTLTLQFADGIHMSYGEEWSKTIEVIVEDN